MPGPSVHPIQQLHRGDHACLLYESRQDQLAAIVAFLKEGLERWECCAYVLDHLTGLEIIRALDAQGVDVLDAHRRGALVMLNKWETYLQGGRFDAHQTTSTFLRLIESKLKAGFKMVRIMAEMSWALEGRAWDRLVDYEANADQICPQANVAAVCQYDVRRFPKSVLQRIEEAHAIRIAGELLTRRSLS